MNDLFKLFDTLINADKLLNSYDDRKIGRDEINGLTVSTCDTPDQGYETAIIDLNKVYIVERYLNKEQAIQGHTKWCEKAKTITHITDVGYGDLVGSSEVVLVRKSFQSI